MKTNNLSFGNVLFIGVLLCALAYYKLNKPPKSPACTDTIDYDVVMFATNWCGYCKQARKLLSENNVNYCEYDVEQSAIGSQRHKELGGVGVPLFLINDKVIDGYDERQLLSLIK